MFDEAFREVINDAVTAALEPVLAELSNLRRLVDARLPDRWLTRAEAAETWRCSVDTVDRRIAAGEIEVHRIGRAVRVRLPVPDPDKVARLAREARP